MTGNDFPDHMLEINEIHQEFTKKSLLKQVVRRKITGILNEINMVSLSLFHFLHEPNYHCDIFNVFSVTKFRCNEFVTHVTSLF
jgi:hypothetical protein